MSKEESDEFVYAGIHDPGTLYEFAILEGDGNFRPFLFERYHTEEEAYVRLSELAQDRTMKFNEEVVFSIVPDA